MRGSWITSPIRRTLIVAAAAVSLLVLGVGAARSVTAADEAPAVDVETVDVPAVDVQPEEVATPTVDPAPTADVVVDRAAPAPARPAPPPR